MGALTNTVDTELLTPPEINIASTSVNIHTAQSPIRGAAREISCADQKRPVSWSCSILVGVGCGPITYERKS